MDPIPGSALGMHSLVDSEGYIAGTSVHASTAPPRQQTSSPNHRTSASAGCSFLGKRKDKDDDECQTVGTSNVAPSQLNQQAARPTKRLRNQAPGAFGFDPDTPPFEWFTRTGNSPLDTNSDLVWMLEHGRYYAYRLSTAQQEPLAPPQLITPESVGKAISRAKQQLGRQKGQITGDPRTQWDDQLPTASLHKSSAALPSTSTKQAQKSITITDHGIHLQFLDEHRFAALPMQPSAATVDAPGNSARSNRIQGPKTFVLTVSNITPRHAQARAVTVTTPGGNTRGRESQARFPSTLVQSIDTDDDLPLRGSSTHYPYAYDAVASVAMPKPSEVYKQAITKGTRASTNPLRSDASKATHLTTCLSETQRQEMYTSLHDMDDHMKQRDTLVAGRKRGLLIDDAEESKSKKARIADEATATLPRPSLDPKHRLPYTLENHMVDSVKQRKKRKAAGSSADAAERKKVRLMGQTLTRPQPRPITRSSVFSSDAEKRATKNAAKSGSHDTPKGFLRIYTAEAREEAKNDPILKMMVNQADQQARERPKAPQEPPGTYSVVHDGEMHQSADTPFDVPIAMSQALKRQWQSLPDAMPAPEKFARLIQQQGHKEYFARQGLQIAEAFGSKKASKVHQKPQTSSSELPPVARFAPPPKVVKARETTTQQQRQQQSGSIPAATSVVAAVTAAARIDSSKKPKSQEPGQNIFKSSVPPSTVATARNTITNPPRPACPQPQPQQPGLMSTVPLVQSLMETPTATYFSIHQRSTTPTRIRTSTTFNVDQTSNTMPVLRDPARQASPLETHVPNVNGVDWLEWPDFEWEPLPLD
ncbi:MAG: hypothetical protein Q9178_006716 [Gyalolechia marmorata]